MASDEWKKRRLEALELCNKLEVQAQESKQKLAKSLNTDIPASLTDTELHILSSLAKAWDEYLELERRPY